MKITKTYNLKADNIQENMIKGNGNVMGVLDRGNDVVFPGFFKQAIPGFLKSGFMPVGHDWAGLPIAMPVKAAEQGGALYCEFEFHSTPMAQEARTVAKERLEKGLSMGLSVGFSTTDEGAKFFTTGAKLLEYAKENGADLSLFDTKSINAHKGMCRGLLPGGCKELHEVSLVAVPMNQYSNATSVKSEEPDIPLPEEPIPDEQIEDLTTENEAAPETKAAFSITTIRELEQALRDGAKLSVKDAKTVVSRFALRDVAAEPITPAESPPPLIDAAAHQARELKLARMLNRFEGLALAAP